jgi:hypothetical protein
VSRLAICQSILSLLNKVIKKAGHLLVYSVLYLVCSHMNNELKLYHRFIVIFSHTLLYLDVIHKCLRIQIDQSCANVSTMILIPKSNI